MNLYLANGTNRLYALSIQLDESSLTYKTYDVYETIKLKQFWETQTGNVLPGSLFDKAPTPAITPAWVTETYSVYESQSPESQTINFSDIQGLSDFSDHGIFMLYSPDSPSYVSPIRPTAPSSVPAGKTSIRVPLHNGYALTTGSKMSPFVHSAFNNNIAMIAICVPFASAPVDQWSIVFNVKDSSLFKLTSGQATTPMQGNSVGKFTKSLLPKVWFTNKTMTVTADGFVDVPFYLGDSTGNPITQSDATVYLKTTAGQLNKQQVTTINGQGTVRLIASHLVSGETATISCGFKLFSGTDDCVVTVN